jgi:Flp pilus assembly protein TadB
MASTSNEQARAADGRFVKRRGASQRADGARDLALLSIAIVAGIIGFVFSVFWVGALVLLGILWGSLAVDRQRRTRSGKSVVAEVIDVVVEQARDVADSVQTNPARRDNKS